jgi:glycosyltransferase involved in cell wall biosynthesis
VKKLSSTILTDFDYHDLGTSFLGTDIGFAYRKDEDKASFNSSLRVLNFMSFGIPSVLTPESAFLEVANHGEHCLFAHSKEDFLMSLHYPMGNHELRRKISENAYQKAQDYHISRVADIYRRYLSQFIGLPAG